MRRLAALLPALLVPLALAAVALQCRPRAAARVQVVQRIGAPGAPGLEPPVEFSRLRLYETTRTAARMAPASSHAVELPAGTLGVTLAHALTAEGDGGAEVEFRALLEVDGERRELHRRVMSSAATDWEAHVLVIDPPGAPAGARLVLETEPLPSARGRLVRPFWGSIVLLGPRAGTPPPRPRFDSVVLISLDTLGAAHLAGFGEDHGITPALDELRRRAFTFTRAYTNYPSTRPAHASMLSGLHPRRHRAFGFQGPVGVRLVTADFAAAGRRTAAITENGYIASVFGFAADFDSYDDGRKGFAGDAAATFARALAWLERAAHVPHPFFLLVHTYEVHSPYTVVTPEGRALLNELDPDYAGPHALAFDAGPFELPHNSGRRPLAAAELRRMRALYLAEIRRQDELLGGFLEPFDEHPAAARTLLVITSDHGEELGEQGFIGHGETLHNRALHVPLIFAGRGIPAGESDEVVQLVDVAPTLLELTGIEAGRDMDGQSLVPLLDGRQWRSRPAFAESRSAPGRCLRQAEPESCDIGLRAVQEGEFKLVTTAIPPAARLHHLGRDPAERRDAAPEFPDAVARLRAALAAYEALPQAFDQAPAPGLDAETRERLRILGYRE